MHPPQPGRKSPARHDVDDGDEADDVLSRESIADVETPLLASDLPPEFVPDKRFQHTVMMMCCIFVGLVEIYSFLTAAPLQEIMEDFICHQHFPDHLMNSPAIQDQRCKEPGVQKTLAMARSWWQTLELWIPLLVQLPYGIIADKYGRRPVIFLSLFGILVEGGLVMFILRHPELFTIWAIVPTPLAYLIGGGSPMATAMVWTILCDAVPTTERTSAFYLISALGIVLSATLNPIAAWLMSMDPWLPMWIGIVFMALGTLSALLVPETLRLRKETDAVRRRDPSATDPLLPTDEAQSDERRVPPKAYVRELLLGARRNTEHIWHFVIGSRDVMLLVAACGFAFPLRTAFEDFILQYTAKRFDWSWSKATYYYTIIKVVALVMLLFVLPVMAKLLARKFGDNPLRRDLYMARFSITFIVLACFFAAAAYVPPVLVISYISYGIGTGFLSQIRALATSVVEPHTIATLNTMVSSMETIMGSVGTPAFGWLLGRGIELGGAWQGLPYLASAVFALGSCLFVWLFRIPQPFV
ncbi:hypothetical protein NLU13_2421 [Sarocladium strictum]|uniref:Major facilitator superfamily (MFS) profile domain-containing protein n=1 Tax=Sarocladium strictum TaxID=5046 RepID=A0AA39LD79_SARSR|nr:hypothetical protein NLU13_2421 [Sarocladium strictum]